MMSGTKIMLNLWNLRETFKDSSLEESASMNNDVTDTISKLKFIGHIQKGEKINVRYLCVQSDTFLNRLARTFFSTDNRTNAFNFIEGIVNRAFEIISLTLIKAPLKNADKKLIQNLLNDLKKSVNGIANLRDTYADDIHYICRLDGLIEMIKSKLEDIEETTEEPRVKSVERNDVFERNDSSVNQVD